MATPILSHHTLAGGLGDILVDVRAGSRSAAQPAVLLIPGFKGFKDFGFFPVFADQLARSGFVAVTVSVSGSGVDAAGDFTRLDRFRHNTYSIELDDLHRVVDTLQAGELGVASPSALGLLGHSRGGGLALLLASECPAVSAVATWSAIGRARRHSEAELAAWREAGTIDVPHARLGVMLPLDFDVAADCLANEAGRLDISAAAAGLQRPWLQAHGTADETVAFGEGEDLALAAGDGHAFLALEGASHGYGGGHPWGGSTPDLDHLFGATTAFFSRHLGS